MSLSREVYDASRDLIAGRLGLAFGDNRRPELERGLTRARRSSEAATPEAYLSWLATVPADDPHWTQLAAHLTVGETYFFRDRAALTALETQILPQLIAARRADGLRRLRLWSAGCATGEEPYSLAIMVDRLLAGAGDWSVTILGTDINAEALATARQARYRAWSFRHTPEPVRDRYFAPVGELFELDPRIRRAVTFAPLNLAQDCYPSVMTNTTAMDVILCKNVLMYFTPQAQRAAVARLMRSLVDGGWLGVSAVEGSVDLLRPLTAVSFSEAVLYRKDAAGPARIAAPPAGWAPSIAPSSPRAVAPSEAPAPSAVGAAAPPAEWSKPVDARAPPAPGLGRARALADQGCLDDARDLCETALAQDRLDLEAHLLLAAVCQEQGEIRAAFEALRRAIYLAPDNAAAHFLLGSLLLTQGDPERGRRSMDTVVRLLTTVAADEVVAGSDGLTAGWLVATAHAYLAPA